MTATQTPDLAGRSSVIGHRSSAAGHRSSVIGALVRLTKPRITLMVALTTMIGFIAAAPSSGPALLWQTILATALVAGAASGFNQVMEREADARMERTQRRPIPSGAIGVVPALAFASILLASGAVWLAVASNVLACALAVFTCASYALVYTPMKQRTWLATIVGAVPGAVPPVIGWAAARGSIGVEALVLFLIMFAWQMPHFYAVAALYREDYRRGGFRVLPVVEPDGRSTGRQAVLWSLALLPLSALPPFAAMASPWYLAPALALGVWFLAASVRFMQAPVDDGRARRLFRLSLLYLPAVFLLIVLL